MKYIHNYFYPNTIYNNIFLKKESDFSEEEEETVFYNLDFIKKSFFFKKTNHGIIINTKSTSLRRNKNINFNNLLINSWIKKGLKLNFLKNYNIFLKNFFFLIVVEKKYFSEFKNFNFVYDLLNSKNYNYKFQNLLVNPLILLEFMFDLRLKKLNKKMKKKYKKKYTYTIKYLYKLKRMKYVLNMLYSSSNFYNNKKYYDRIFFNFLYIIFDTKNTPIWEKKLNTYKIALKFLKKK